MKPFFSLEFFPPKTEMGVLNLYDRFDRFAALNPFWIDVTWGAGGSTSERTLELCYHALKFHGLEPLMHLTCTNMTEKLLEDTLATVGYMSSILGLTFHAMMVLDIFCVVVTLVLLLDLCKPLFDLQCFKKGIRNLLALRGDPPANNQDWNASQGQFKYAIDLVKYIRVRYRSLFIWRLLLGIIM